jgi:hypothetical protein
MNKIKEEVSYQELSRRVGDCVLNNYIHNELTKEGDEWELFNGDDYYCNIHETTEECDKDSDKCEEDAKEIYQEYIITQSGADYLKRNTNEIVYYCEDLDIYLWGITHFGTSWSGVFTTLQDKEE